jgi:uncharacterized protein (TIGR02246 family)
MDRSALPSRPPIQLRILGASLLVLVLATVSLAAQSPEDEPAIRKVLLALPDAWNARDANAWAENFTPDSGFVNILGMRFPDRASNQERHAALFATIFRDSTLHAEVLHIRFTDPDTAVAEVLFRLVGYKALPPGIGETAPGVLETRLVDVLQKINGHWRIVFSQNTAIVPR